MVPYWDLRIISCRCDYGVMIPDIPSLKLTWPLKMDGWNISFLLGWTIFRGYVNFRECIFVLFPRLSASSKLVVWGPVVWIHKGPFYEKGLP